MSNTPHISDRELTTILAALRHFQQDFDHTSKMKTAYPDAFADVSPLQQAEINALCARLELPGDPTKPATVEVPALDGDDKHTILPHVLLERRIVANLIAHMQAAGFEIKYVFDTEEEVQCTTTKEAMEAIFAVDLAHLHMQKKGFKRHFIMLVLGNGFDIISDYSYTPGDPDGWIVAVDSFDPEKFA